MSDVKSGKASFMPTNMIVDSVTGIVASSQAVGAVTKPQKEGSGSAGAILTGSYSGSENLDYVVQIETTGEIGVATFKWSNDGGATFPHTGVATSTAAVLLENGVSIKWTQGSGNDVVAGDVWRFKGYLPYHRNKVLDRDRDSEWRSTGVTSESLTFDLGTAQTPTVLVILDHNMTSSASIRLQGANVSNFSALVSDYIVPYQASKILYFLGDPLNSARYWRVQFSNPGLSDGYIRMSEVFLGAYTRLSRSFELGDIRGRKRMGQRDQQLSGKYFGAAQTVVNTFEIGWVRLNQTDRDLLIAVFDALQDLTNRQVNPVFFSPMSTDLSKIYLCEWEEGQVMATSEQDAPERYTVPARLCELPRTVSTT